MNPTDDFSNLLIHVGLHKTGTTWLQRNLFERRHGNEIEYSGDPAYICESFLLPSISDYSAAATRQAFTSFVDKARRANRLAVISCEELSGWPFHRWYMREVLADRLARTFPGAKLLITIREQTAIIYSIYGQYLRYGYSSTLAEFLTPKRQDSGLHPIFDRTYYDYERLLSEYAHFFAPNNIIVVPMEWLVAEPDAVMAYLSQRTGYQFSPLGAGAFSQPENPAWSDLAYFAVRQFNKIVSQDARWQYERRLLNPNAWGFKVDRLTPSFLRHSMRASKINYIDNAIGDLYSTSNAVVTKIIGIDLARYGYRK